MEKLRWGGNQEAQRQADEAFAKLKASNATAGRQAKASHKRRKPSGRFVGTYQDYLKSPQWRKKRKTAMRIHRGRCAVCGSMDRLEVHHKHYKTVFRENPATDLELLCKDCHSIHHEDKGAVDFMTARFLDMVRDF